MLLYYYDKLSQNLQHRKPIWLHKLNFTTINFTLFNSSFAFYTSAINSLHIRFSASAEGST